jgi:NAD(P) transhydrogenase subunit alpha
MYSHNVSTFLQHLVEQGDLQIDLEDEITRETLVARDGEVVHQRVRQLIAPEAPATEES